MDKQIQSVTSSSTTAETAQNLICFRLMSGVSCKIMQKIAAFGLPHGGIRGNISALSESFNANELCFIKRMSVLLIKQQIRVYEPLFGSYG